MPDSNTSRPDVRRTLFSFAQIQHVLRVEFGRAQRHRYPLACLVLAIDQLGTIRDRRGYEAKERIVEGVVDLLKDATRSSDFLGRTADDRLIAVIPHTPIEGARTLGRRLIEGVRRLTVEHGEDPERETPSPERVTPSPERVTLSPERVTPSPERVTLSLGACASADGSVMYSDALLEAAQAALDEAVAMGGDRCVERTPDRPL